MVGTDASRVEANGASAEPLAPVGEGERVELLDILRGVAIFGILVVNLQMFFSPVYLWFSTADWWTAPIDKATQRLVFFVAQGKFYALFSFLFGVGMAIQLQRATQRGDRFVSSCLGVDEAQTTGSGFQ